MNRKFKRAAFFINYVKCPLKILFSYAPCEFSTVPKCYDRHEQRQHFFLSPFLSTNNSQLLASVYLLHFQNKRIRFHCKINKALVLNFSLLAAVTQAWSSVCQVHTLLYGI